MEAIRKVMTTAEKECIPNILKSNYQISLNKQGVAEMKRCYHMRIF